jgi:hypothetical protein
MFHVDASRDEKVSEAYGFDTRRLLVPSAKDIPLVVLTIMYWGVDRYPTESRTVTFCPGGT